MQHFGKQKAAISCEIWLLLSEGLLKTVCCNIVQFSSNVHHLTEFNEIASWQHNYSDAAAMVIATYLDGPA